MQLLSCNWCNDPALTERVVAHDHGVMTAIRCSEAQGKPDMGYTTPGTNQEG